MFFKVNENPRTSIREIKSNLELPYYQIQRVLKEEKMKPFKIHITYTLRLRDSLRRLQFCHWLAEQDDNFLGNVIWTDECSFTNLGLFNRHNEHYWARENPHINYEARPQHRFGINIWVGLWRDRVVGPFIFNETLNAERYLNFLNTNVLNYLEDVPLIQLRDIWWQQDGAPAHNERRVVNRLNEIFPNHWIGTNGPVSWPARSPDLNPLDFFLWGYVKNSVYKNHYNNVEELRIAVLRALHGIPRRTIQRVLINGVKKRCRLCIAEDGNIFEHRL